MSKQEQYPPPYAQPGYPPPQPGYPPAQPGYPPAQPGYPPSQPGYPPPQPGYPPPQPGYAPGSYGGQMATTNVVVTQQAAVVHPAMMRESPVQMQCPHCNAQIVTSLDYQTGTLTWLIAAGLCFFGMAAGCCLIPFCVDSCKDVIHTCPNCKGKVGAYRRL